MLEEIKNTLRDYLMEHFDIEPDDPDFSDEVHLFDYGYVDSLGATEIILFLESTYSVEITQRDITLFPMNTLNEIAEVVAKKLEA